MDAWVLMWAAPPDAFRSKAQAPRLYRLFAAAAISGMTSLTDLPSTAGSFGPTLLNDFSSSCPETSNTPQAPLIISNLSLCPELRFRKSNRGTPCLKLPDSDRPA